MSKLKSHSHILSLFQSHSVTLAMLDNFCFHVSAQKSKVVQHVKSERVKVVIVVKVCQVFQNIPGSQLLSDIQTFFKTDNPGIKIIHLA